MSTPFCLQFKAISKEAAGIASYSDLKKAVNDKFFLRSLDWTMQHVGVDGSLRKIENEQDFMLVQTLSAKSQRTPQILIELAMSKRAEPVSSGQSVPTKSEQHASEAD